MVVSRSGLASININHQYVCGSQSITVPQRRCSGRHALAKDDQLEATPHRAALPGSRPPAFAGHSMENLAARSESDKAVSHSWI